MQEMSEVSMNNDLLVPRRLSVSSIGRAISRGWALFLISRPVSVTYAMLFAVFGLLIFIAIEHASVAPMRKVASAGRRQRSTPGS